MGKRNAQALAAMMRKAGPHGGSRRPQSYRPHGLEEFDESRECPDCNGCGIDFETEPPYEGYDGSCEHCDGTGFVYD